MARIQSLFGIEHPILQAPMAGSSDSRLAIAVALAGGLGSIPCALLGAAQIRAEASAFRGATTRPLNLNFFCHQAPEVDDAREAAWRQRLAPYYREHGLELGAPAAAANRAPFDAALADLVSELRPEVVSFHFGLPERALLEQVRGSGAKIISSATTVAEARYLEEHGVDAIIAQGSEAGGHRGLFLTDTVANQVGTFALVPQVVDAVELPVIAAGGIADARGVRAAFALGAAGVQLGTAFLFCPEARASATHRAALAEARDDSTVLTNLFTGRPARGIVNRFVREVGPLSELAPSFPLAGTAVAPLRAVDQARGTSDFSPLWAGQAARLGRELPAGELVRQLAAACVTAIPGT